MSKSKKYVTLSDVLLDALAFTEVDELVDYYKYMSMDIITASIRRTLASMQVFTDSDLTRFAHFIYLRNEHATTATVSQRTYSLTIEAIGSKAQMSNELRERLETCVQDFHRDYGISVTIGDETSPKQSLSVNNSIIGDISQSN